MIAAANQTGQLIVYVTDNPIDDEIVSSLKEDVPGARILADLLEPLYDTSIPTRQAAYTLGRVKAELENIVDSGERVAIICRRRVEDLGTRSHFLASLCAMADRVHFLKST
jgi:hypothetical protein